MAAATSTASQAPTTRFWHPFSAMGLVRDAELVITRGEGARVFDATGHAYLDATASLWYANVGHGRRELAEAAAAQMGQIAAFSCFGDVATAPTLELSARLSALAPMDDAVVFLTSGGSDGVETAAKVARRYWSATGRPAKRVLIAREGAYHGTHGFGTGLAGIPANREGFGETVADTQHTAANDLGALRELVARTGADRIAAVFVEPVIGAGGVVPPAPGYLEGVQALCREHDILLVADEVITGFGRLGTWFACQRFGLQPDLLIGAKGLTSGYQPMGCVLVAPSVAEPFWRREEPVTLRHGYTYSGHATAAAVALANLDIIEREGLLQRVAELEPVLAEEVARLEQHPLVAEVRSIGLLAGIQLVDAALPVRVTAASRSLGVLTRAIGRDSLQVSPPFTVGEDDLREIGTALRAALDLVQAEGVA